MRGRYSVERRTLSEIEREYFSFVEERRIQCCVFDESYDCMPPRTRLLEPFDL